RGRSRGPLLAVLLRDRPEEPVDVRPALADPCTQGELVGLAVGLEDDPRGALKLDDQRNGRDSPRAGLSANVVPSQLVGLEGARQGALTASRGHVDRPSMYASGSL